MVSDFPILEERVYEPFQVRLYLYGASVYRVLRRGDE